VLGLGEGLGQGKEKRKGACGRERKTWAGCGPRGKRRGGPREKRGWTGWALFFSFSLFHLNLFTQIYLNSNKFEFKPYKFNTEKTMLQHECTTNLIL
jgi:hypothetical protein